jgi:hypothetical protein
LKYIGFLFLAATLGSLPAFAGTDFFQTDIPIPAGLRVGDEFQLMFITTSTTEATSTDISYYNNFVNTDANTAAGSLVTGLGITWSVLGSTSTVNVLSNIVNTPSTVGIYDLAGTLIANGTGTTGTGLYSGSTVNPPDVTDTGAVNSTHVWTGTDDSGAASNGCGNGASPLGGSLSESGYSGFAAIWTQSCSVDAPTISQPLYAISNVLILGSDDQIEVVPEPATLAVTGIGLVSLWFLARRRGAAAACRKS